MMSHVLAVDIGGSSIRAAMVAQDGGIGALASRPNRVVADARGWSEADPAAWWRDATALAAEVIAASGASPAAIVLGGMTRTQILVDGAGRVLRPAICFPDSRAGAEAGAIGDLGTWGPVNAFHPAARLLWLARHEPAILDRAAAVLQPKDWLIARLTGRLVGDRIANAGLIDRKLGQAVALERFGLPALVPELLDPLDRAGTVRSGLEGWPAGIPVFTGSMDTWCCVLGMGAHTLPGAYLLSGTSDVVGVLSDCPREAPGLVTLPWGEGAYHLGGPSLSGADAASWFAELLGEELGAVLEILEGSLPGAGLLFLPYLAGERVPLWRPDARGAFLGLARRHGRADLAFAILEGLAFANRDIVERAGLDPAQPIRIGGGGARSDLWCQVRADAIGRPLLRAGTAEPGLLGAAIVGFTGLGHFASLAEGQANLAAPETRFDPDPARRDRADALYAQFKVAQDSVQPLSSALARLDAASA